MKTLCTAYCILCAITALLFAVAALCRHLALRAERRNERRFARQYMNLIAQRMLDPDGVPMSQFPMCERRGARKVLARLLTAASSACFEEPAALRRMAAANGIEGWLLRKVRLSHGYNRARYLAMLSTLPVSPPTAEYISRYGSHSDRRTAFKTMLVTIASDPAETVRILMRFPHTLTPLEMAELTAMLRRGLLPIAYAPLLGSQNRNLRMLGLNIVRIFGITESEQLLLQLLADSNPHPEACRFRDETVYVMMSLHLPVSRRQTAAHIRSMSPLSRRALLRRLAAEGYSVTALTRLAQEDEQHYAETLAASYKRTLVCGT
ncbi:MAG: hypothetical protein J1E04_02525 [Alistipes sp.]|nr:hypothetical protein [Alistipes sp.]